MINIFEVFLPQLLRYPNPNDPLNGEAAALLMRHPKEYDAKVKGTTRSSSIIYKPEYSLMLILSQTTFNAMLLEKLLMRRPRMGKPKTKMRTWR